MFRASTWILIAASSLAAYAQSTPAPRIFNTVKQKLAEGKQVVGGTVSHGDPDTYCAMANSGFDFTWIEMQHSPLTYTDVARMVWACRGASAIPFIRVPDATEGDIQKATDLGALGIIIPMVDSVEKVKNAVRFAKYPPLGVRSQGGGQHGSLWGADYRKAANDNIMIIAMIESPTGAAIANEIASVPGVDVVFVASTDLSSFSALPQGDPKYESMVAGIRDTVLKNGRKVGGPLAWKERQGYAFFQGPGESILIRAGAKAALSGTLNESGRRGVAATEGSEKK